MFKYIINWPTKIFNRLLLNLEQNTKNWYGLIRSKCIVDWLRLTNFTVYHPTYPDNPKIWCINDLVRILYKNLFFQNWIESGFEKTIVAVFFKRLLELINSLAVIVNFIIITRVFFSSDYHCSRVSWGQESRLVLIDS